MSRVRLTDGTCATCGRATEGFREYRSYCSRACQNEASRYPAGRPAGRPCVLCGTWIDYNVRRPGGRKVKLGTKKCFDCRRDSRYALTASQIAERDGSDCSICAEPVDLSLKWPDRMSATRDHVVPVTHGGSNAAENLRLAHLSCNSRKGNRVERAA